MLISAVQKFTTLDYPEKHACIVFFAGCPFRCGYCHNPDFVLPEKIKQFKNNFISIDSVLNFLKGRVGLLDGVVLSGGEPLMSPKIKDLIKSIRQLGFLIKVDTNGFYPDKLKELIDEKFIDFIALDYKTSAQNYESLVGIDASKNVLRSLEIIKNSGLPYEIRTTIVKEIHSSEIFEAMGKELSGINNYFLQSFRSNTTLDDKFQVWHGFSLVEMNEVLKKYFNSIKKTSARI